MNKRIIVVFNGTHFSKNALDYAISIAARSRDMLVGVFLRETQVTSYPFLNDLPLTGAPVYAELPDEEYQRLLKENMQQFTGHCADAHIKSTVYKEDTVTLDVLLHESAFADLLVMDAKMDLEGYVTSEKAVSASLKDVLVDAHCPVLVIPEQVQPVDEVILAYDGGYSGMYAIKQYSYIFEEWKDLPTHLLIVNLSTDVDQQEVAAAKEWLDLHFGNLQLKVLHGKVSEELTKYIREREDNTLVVMGAYGRKAVSRLFRQSLANYILTEANVPVFITHE